MLTNKIIDYLPDYLKGFEDIEKLCDGLDIYCTLFEIHCMRYINKVRLGSGDGKRWRRMVYDNVGMEKVGERVALLHRLVIKPTVEDYAEYIRHWIWDGEFELVFDKETETFILTIIKDSYFEEEKRQIFRNLFPMNAKLVINFEQ